MANKRKAEDLPEDNNSKRFKTEHDLKEFKFDSNNSIVEPLLDDLNNIVLQYVVEAPFDEFIRECIEGNIPIIGYLQDNFRFDINCNRAVLQKAYHNNICLSKSTLIIYWFELEFNIKCFPLRCLKTTIRANNMNYKMYAEGCMRIINESGDDEDFRYAIFKEIIDNGTFEMLKYMVEEAKCKLPGDQIAQFCRIKDLDMLQYIYARVESQEWKVELRQAFDTHLRKICETNDLKYIMPYCETNLDILKANNDHVDEDDTPVVLSLMLTSMLSIDSEPHIASQFAWINLDVIMYLFKILPPTADHIKKERSIIRRYIRQTQSTLLLKMVEDIIGMNLIFL